METNIALTITENGMPIPYADVDRGNSKNYGFKNLKGNPDEVLKIFEASDNKTLQNALLNINAEETGFFTVGCEKSFNKHPNGYWAKGFIQISFNYVSLVENPQCYFKLFFDFNNFIRNNNLGELPINYHFELENAVFTNVKCGGYTIIVWIQTSFFKDEETSHKVWEKAVENLSKYICELDFQNNYLAITGNDKRIY